MEYLLSLAVSIAITVFLVIDAPKHNKSPVLWGILGFFFGFLTLGIYLIQTGRKVLGWILIGLFIVIVILSFLFFAVLFSMVFSGY